MPNCLIDSGAVIDCQNIPRGGVKKYVLLYNYTEWATMVAAGNVTVETDGTISGITNSVGVQAFKFEVPDETGLVLGSPLVPIEGGFNSYDHSLNFSVVSTTQAAKNNISKLRFQNIVAIVDKNNGKGEIYGQEQGLTLTTVDYAPTDPLVGAIIKIELKTSDTGVKETQMPADVYDTDDATTAALITSLTIVGS